MITNNDVWNALHELGNSTGAIAKTLNSNGIKGVKGKANWCPIARWLQFKFPGAFVHVTSCEVQMSRDHHLNDLWIYNSEPLGDFITEFDMGYYPELVEVHDDH